MVRMVVRMVVVVVEGIAVVVRRRLVKVVAQMV